ncbi:MAG: phosphoglucosamine mutase [Holosporales bacterium]|jgi:phosphoglucosamine mutase|nr:phosphoglucosamine mutase [Holosporales bacterium]
MKLFGTDGVRGIANRPPITPEICVRLAQAAGLEFKRGEYQHRVAIAKDTRLSGYLIEPALTSGFLSTGMNVILMGPLPTPAVAFLTRSLRADLGVMISASHNPYTDNGIKLFGPDGLKLSDEIQTRIEERFSHLPEDFPIGADLGSAMRLDDALGRYIEFVKSTFNCRQSLDSLKIVLDCANGAAYRAAPTILWELGTEVIPIAVEPDGLNINAQCGATYPNTMRAAVLEHEAHLGIALDGDADRTIMCDACGNILDGDAILAIIAKSWQEEGRLANACVALTEMSNMALDRYLNGMGINVIRTKVGDRYISSAMRKHHLNLGSEKSGHILFGDYGILGDGLVAALQVLTVMQHTGQSLADLAACYVPFPQCQENVHIQDRDIVHTAPIQQMIASCSARLGTRGRLLVRPSGTEPVLRLMVESEDATLIQSVMDEALCALKPYMHG